MRTHLTPSSKSKKAVAFGLGVLFLAPVLGWATGPTPIVELLFNEGTGVGTVNSGSGGGAGSLSLPYPIWSGNVPANTGTSSLDFGDAQNGFVVDFPTLNALKSLKSFTITGWMNCRNGGNGPGGNRILSWINAGGNGVDLSTYADGHLTLGINQWNDFGGVSSSAGKFPISSSAAFGNWRFFAVSYDGTQSANQVKFYFGSQAAYASIDVCQTYNRGTVGANIGPLAVGNHNTLTTARATNQFRGLLNDIRVYGNANDGTGALAPSDIIMIQNNPLASGIGGIRYEEWSNISGSSIVDLVGNANFPDNPTRSLVRPSFDGFQNVGDNVGVRMTGWVLAPEDGNYFFWINSDDNGELRLSTDANPANKRIIAYQPGWDSYQAWDAGDSHKKSAAIPLQKGRYYYIEALMKEGITNDNLSVGWQLPSGAFERPIPAGRVYLQPDIPDAYFPSSITLYEKGTSNAKTTMSWDKIDGVNDHYSIKLGNSEKLKINDGGVSSTFGFYANHPAPGPNGYTYSSMTNSEIKSYKQEGPTNSKSYETILNSMGLAYSVKSLSTNPVSTLSESKINDVGISTTGTVTAIGGLFAPHPAPGPNGYYYSSVTNTEIKNFRTEGLPIVKTYETIVNSSGLSYRTTSSGATQSESKITSDGFWTDGSVTAMTVVTTPKWKIPDYVFEKGYDLKSLEEVDRFVKKNKHLPNVPSAKDIKARGMDLTEMNVKLLEKVEELTLHLIAMDKEVKALKAGRRLGSREAALPAKTGVKGE